MHPINSRETGSREPKSHWHCLAMLSTAFERHSSRLVPVSVQKDLKGCSVPTLATLTACREVGVFYNRRVAKSSETTPQEMPMAAAVSTFRVRVQRRQITERCASVRKQTTDSEVNFTRAICVIMRHSGFQNRFPAPCHAFIALSQLKAGVFASDFRGIPPAATIGPAGLPDQARTAAESPGMRPFS